MLLELHRHIMIGITLWYRRVFLDRDVDVRSVAADVATWDAMFFEEAIRTRQEKRVLRSAKKKLRFSPKLKNEKGSSSESVIKQGYVFAVFLCINSLSQYFKVLKSWIWSKFYYLLDAFEHIFSTVE